jgi:predicted permease
MLLSLLPYTLIGKMTVTPLSASGFAKTLGILQRRRVTNVLFLSSGSPTMPASL